MVCQAARPGLRGRLRVASLGALSNLYKRARSRGAFLRATIQYGTSIEARPSQSRGEVLEVHDAALLVEAARRYHPCPLDKGRRVAGRSPMSCRDVPGSRVARGRSPGPGGADVSFRSQRPSRSGPIAGAGSRPSVPTGRAALAAARRDFAAVRVQQGIARRQSCSFRLAHGREAM